MPLSPSDYIFIAVVVWSFVLASSVVALAMLFAIAGSLSAVAEWLERKLVSWWNKSPGNQ